MESNEKCCYLKSIDPKKLLVLINLMAPKYFEMLVWLNAERLMFLNKDLSQSLVA